MSAVADKPSPFEPIVLEDDPAFDVKKEYQDELDYYYETHPNDMGYVPSKSLKDSAVGFLGGLRSGIEKVVEARDELYGYNDETKGPRIHLKPVAEMNFLPEGMNYGGGSQKRNGGGFGLSLPYEETFSSSGNAGRLLQPSEVSKTKKQPPCHKKKDKKLPCCSCKDIKCLDNPRYCKEEGKKKSKKEKPIVDILSSDPFGIGEGKKLF